MWTSSFSNRVVNPSNRKCIDQSPSDTISQLVWCRKKPILCASSWSCGVSSWVVDYDSEEGDISSRSLMEFKHKEPVLCCDISNDGKVFSGSCDGKILCTPLPGVNLGMGIGKQFVEIGTHDDCVRKLHYVEEKEMLISCGWDKRIKFWDMKGKNSKNGSICISVSSPIYCSDQRDDLLIVCGRKQKVLVFDIRNTNEPLRVTSSTLRLQTKCVKIFPSIFVKDEGMDGFVVGDIEGRTSVQFLSKNTHPPLPLSKKNHHNDDENKHWGENFIFKSHNENTRNYDREHSFPVNDFSFHEQSGTLSSCGSNGRFYFWNLRNQSQLFFTYHRHSLPITCGQFSGDGNIFAYAIGYDFTAGGTDQTFMQGVRSKILFQKVLPQSMLK